MIKQADFMTNDGVRLHYYDTGTDKRPLLCLPGIGGSAFLWLKAVEIWQPDFRVIILDPRNQGQSERTFRGQRISRHAADLAQFICQLNLTDIIGVGNSMGAANWWAYLSLYGSERLTALVDLDQPPKMINEPAWPFGFKDLTWDNFPAYLQLDFGTGCYAHIDDAMFAQAKKQAQQFPYQPAANYLCRLDHAVQDWRDVLVKLDLPLLILAGENSPFFDYHFAQVSAELNALITAQTVPNCGHLIQAEQPELMCAAVNDFLAALGSSD